MLYLKVTPAIKIQTKQLKSAYNNLNLVLITYIKFNKFLSSQNCKFMNIIIYYN